MLKIFKLITFYIVLFLSCINLFAKDLFISSEKNTYCLELPQSIVTDKSESTNTDDVYFLSYDIFPVSDFLKYGLGKWFYTSPYYYKKLKTITYDNLKEGLNKGYPLINDPGVFESWSKQFFEDFFIFDIYQNQTLGGTLDSIGWYNILVCKDDTVFLFYFSSTRPIDDFATSLTKYIKPKRNTQSESDALQGLERSGGFPYSIYNAPEKLYQDMKNNNSELPLYIRNFRQTYEELLSSIIECYRQNVQ